LCAVLAVSARSLMRQEFCWVYYFTEASIAIVWFALI
jgi:hypothetical protein